MTLIEQICAGRDWQSKKAWLQQKDVIFPKRWHPLCVRRC